MSGVDLSKYRKQPTIATSTSQKSDGGVLSFLNKDIKLFKGVMGDKKKEAFYSELSILMDAGLDIRSSMEMIESEQKNNKDKQLFSAIKEAIIKGDSLSEALKGSGQFSDYEYFSIRIGEEAGKLGEILSGLAVYFQKRIKQKRQLISALSYPSVILLVSVGAIVFMMNFIVPMFSDVFKRLDGELPAITRFVISASEMVSNSFLYVFTLCIILGVLLYLQRNTDWYRRLSAQLTLYIPIFGDLIRKVHLARFANVMALLIKSKVPLVQSLNMVARMTTFFPIENSLKTIETDVMHGSGLNESMGKFSIYYPRMVSLIRVGEEVNQLDNFFQKIADQYTDDVEHQTSMMGSLIEPFIIIFLGVVVGTILIAMYLPLFQLSTSFGG